MEKVKRILIISNDENLRETLRFCFDGWGYEVFIWDTHADDINAIKNTSPDVIVVDVHAARHTDLKICQLLKTDFVTSFIPVITLINKRHLRSQLLDLKHGVDDYLIKPPDPLDLRIRIEMAIRRSQHSFYASPLTGLPGGRIIEEMLSEKVKEKAEFSFGYMDIDNFKYFNDVYGYLKGDRAIMHTAYMLYDTVRKFGGKEDFIGHIGGDDFVFISTFDKYIQICEEFIRAFNRVIPFHYSASDREKGFIMAKDRTRKIKKIPLMSISIAVVNKRNGDEINNAIDINERVAEIKKFLKSMPGSKYMADRRNSAVDASGSPQVYDEGNQPFSYKPLGQILLEKKFVSGEQLDEALRVHWRRGVIFGEVLKELGFLKDEQLREALDTQRAMVSTYQ